MRTADPELHERRKNQILSAAEKCFIEKGFHQASVADIATAAGLSMGLMYRYFKNKEEIVLSFAARDHEMTLLGIEEFAKSDKPRTTLSRHLDFMLSEAFDNAAARIVVEVMAEAGRNKSLLNALQKDDSAVRQAFSTAIKAQQRAGRIDKALDATMAASVLITLFDGLLGRALCEPNINQARFKKTLSKAIDNILMFTP
jgi:AcrR family transcriptional regulator